MIPKRPRHRYPSKRPKYLHGHSHRNKFSLNRQTIEYEYRELKSGIKVAEQYGVSDVAVYNMLRKIGAQILPREDVEEHKQRFGRTMELHVLEALPAAFDISGPNWRAPFDVIWSGMRINVKASAPTYAGNNKERNTWSFNTRNKKNTDAFLCIGVNESGVIESIYLIPSNEAKKMTTIRRLGKTKYEKYRTTIEELNGK